MDNFYVYIHKRLDTLEVFYVGRGSGNRAHSKYSRNQYWKNIVNKYGYSVEIVKSGLSLEASYLIEVEITKYYKSIGQAEASLCVGGKSNVGYKFTDEQRKKCAINGSRNYWFGKNRSGPNNPNYKKQWTQEFKDKIKNSKCKKIYTSPFGEFYSLYDLSKISGLSRPAVGYRINSEKFPEWTWRYK